jgi:hypothetical protein
LTIHCPSRHTLGLGLVLLVCLAGLVELAARTPLVQRGVPFQAYGTNHIQFEMQLKRLNSFIAQRGEPDCFIFGTSQSLRGIDPQVVAEIYLEKTGEDLLCYNFSVNGSNVAITLYFSQFLIREYRPRLVILGTSFLDYTEEREQRVDARFEDNPWIHYQRGDFSVTGWLSEHSYAWRLLTLLSYAAPQGLDLSATLKEARTWENQLTEFGYGYSDEQIDPSQPAKQGFVKNFLEQFGGFTLSERNLQAVEEIARYCKQEGLQLQIVEMPYHPSLIELRGADGQRRAPTEELQEFIRQVNERLAAIAERNGALYWQTGDLPPFPEDGWHDLYHFNHKGGAVFSRWLAGRLAEAAGR